MNYQILAETENLDNRAYVPGDKVVFKDGLHEEIFEYHHYSEGQKLHFFESEYNYGHAELHKVRLATADELQAGKRLEGNINA